jgi:hypothetical protein
MTGETVDRYLPRNHLIVRPGEGVPLNGGAALHPISHNHHDTPQIGLARNPLPTS